MSRPQPIPFFSPVELYAAMVHGAPESVEWIGLGPLSQADKDYALELEPTARRLVLDPDGDTDPAPPHL